MHVVTFMPTVFRGDGAVEVESDSEVEERPDGQNTTLKIDDWVVFRVDAEAAHLALQLRQKWHSLFLRRMRAPAKPWSQVHITCNGFSLLYIVSKIY
jgi:hypothetical protein